MDKKTVLVTMVTTPADPAEVPSKKHPSQEHYCRWLKQRAREAMQGSHQMLVTWSQIISGPHHELRKRPF